MARFGILRRSEIVLLCCLATVFVSSVSLAARSAQQIGKTGTAADFVATFPWLAVALFGGLVSVLSVLVIYIVRQFARKTDNTARKLEDSAEQTTQKIGQVVEKMEKFVQALYDRDHENEKKISAIDARLTGVEANCAARSLICPLANHKGVFCLDRREGEDRREEEGGEDQGGGQ